MTQTDSPAHDRPATGPLRPRRKAIWQKQIEELLESERAAMPVVKSPSQRASRKDQAFGPLPPNSPPGPACPHSPESSGARPRAGACRIAPGQETGGHRNRLIGRLPSPATCAVAIMALLCVLRPWEMMGVMLLFSWLLMGAYLIFGARRLHQRAQSVLGRMRHWRGRSADIVARRAPAPGARTSLPGKPASKGPAGARAGRPVPGAVTRWLGSLRSRLVKSPSDPADRARQPAASP